MVQINNKYQNYIIDIHLRNMVRVAFKKNFKLFDYRKERACIGRIQTLLRKSVKFLTFGKILWSRDSPL